MGLMGLTGLRLLSSDAEVDVEVRRQVTAAAALWPTLTEAVGCLECQRIFRHLEVKTRRCPHCGSAATFDVAALIARSGTASSSESSSESSESEVAALRLKLRLRLEAAVMVQRLDEVLSKRSPENQGADQRSGGAEQVVR